MGNNQSAIDAGRRVEKLIAAMTSEAYQRLNPQLSMEEAEHRVSQAEAFVNALPYNPLQDELDWRHGQPDMEEITLSEMEIRLRALGYRLQRSSDCPHVSRYMTGPRAGKTYPSVSMRPVQIDDGLGFANVDARKDANFEALQKLRGSIYFVGPKGIYEL